MGFFRSLKKVVGNIANPVTGIAAATTGGLSLLAPPKVQTQIGMGIISFAAGGTAGVFGGPGATSQARAAAQTGRGPQAARGHSPTSFGQRQGRQRYQQRRTNLVYPPSPGDPPSQTGFLYRGVPRQRMRRFRA